MSDNRVHGLVYFGIFLLFAGLFFVTLPTTKADDQNLASISDFGGWRDPDNIYTYQTSFQGKTALKTVYSPIYGAAPSSRGENELDGPWIPVHPGDRIYYHTLVWTTDSSFGDTDQFDGGRVGMDMYGDARICEIDTTDGRQGIDSFWSEYDPAFYALSVPWGSGRWVSVTMDFIVPDSYLPDWNSIIPQGPYPEGIPIEPTGIIPWLNGPTSLTYQQSHGTQIETGAVYYADTELYINPTNQQLTSPTPTSTPDIPFVPPSQHSASTSRTIHATPSPTPLATSQESFFGSFQLTTQEIIIGACIAAVLAVLIVAKKK